MSTFVYSSGLGFFLPDITTQTTNSDNSQQNIYNVGTRVGIVNSNPVSTLTVGGDTTSYGNVIATSNLQGNALIVNIQQSNIWLNYPVTQFGSLLSSSNSLIIGGSSNWYNASSIITDGRNSSGGGVLGLNALDNGFIQFNTVNSVGAGTEWMRMSSLGYLGINTTVPSYPLDVNGTINLNKAQTNNNKLLVLYDGNSNDSLSTACNFFGLGINANTLRYQVPVLETHKWFIGNSNLMTLSNTYVGIGTSNPAYPLDVSGQIHTNSGLVINSSTYTDTILNAWSNTAYTNASTANYASNNFSNLPWQIDASGVYTQSNVGIGTTSPAYALDVGGTVNVNKNLNGYNKLLVLYDGNSNDSISTACNFLGFGVNSAALRNQVPNNNMFKWYIGPSNVMTMSNGNLGIGTSNPGYALDVVGQIHTNSGLVINSSTYTDTVLNTWSNNIYNTSNTAIFASNLSVYSSNQFKNIPWNVNSSAVYTFSNVAIGVSNAITPLTIENTAAGTLNITGTYGANTYTGNSSSSNGIIMALNVNYSNNRQLLLIDGGTPASTSSNFALRFNVNGLSNSIPSIDSISTNGLNGGMIGIGNTAGVNIPGNLGIGTLTPAYQLDVSGVIHANSNILCTSTGTINTTLILQYAYMDVPVGSSTFAINAEPGNNYSYQGSTFNQGFLNGSNCSGETIAWNRGRLIIRSCTNNTNKTASTWSNVAIRCYNSNTQAWNTLTNTTIADQGSFYGYTTNITPWFSLGSYTTTTCLGIQIPGSGATVRIGPTYLNLSS